MDERPIAIAVAARPYPGETISGDAWQVDWVDGVCRIAVVDGLGHGPLAAAAAASATAHLAGSPAADPATTIEGCHLALKGTRGAALLVARIDLDVGRLTVAGVGNVEARLWQDGRSQHLLSDRGIVGVTLPRVRPVEMALAPKWLLLVYTDGIRNRFKESDVARATENGQACAHAVLADWGRATDDATVLVAHPR